MRIAGVVALSLMLSTAGCGSPAAPTDTGLAGTVVRGPIQPVCQANVPCDAPFSAGFTVQRGATRVGTFQSDSLGHFEVRLSPGSYVVVADADAPIISPKSQTKEVIVGPSGLTVVELHFDTGIR